MKIISTLFFILIIINSGSAQSGLPFSNKHQVGIQSQIFTGTSSTLDELPADFPKIKVDTSNNPAPGYLFLSTFSITPKAPSYIMVLDSLAKPYYYHKPALGGIDFKMNPNGTFSYASAIGVGDVHQVGPLTVQNAKVIDYILDSKFNKIDSVQCKNGYLSDTHEFRVLPNGNFLMMSYEMVPVDMSKLVAGGNPNATVIGTVVQEIDANKNCVFQWRSLDHIPITETLDNQLLATFEHVHGNAYHLDTDGNLLVSFATTCEIVKIDMISGKIIWRFGGNHSDFEIKNDNNDIFKPLYFSLQHDVKRLSNGNLLFFDNGFGKTPKFARAVEYTLDEANRSASMIWEYRHTPDIAPFAMGSAQRLPNGNTLIDWGMIPFGFFRTVTEVTPTKDIAYELSLPSDAYSYRGLKYQLPACQPISDVTISEALEGNTYKFKDKKTTTGTELYLKKLNAFTYNYITIKKFDCSAINPQFTGEAPVILPVRYTLNTQYLYSFSGELRFDLAQLPPLYKYDSMKVYFRLKEGNSVFAELPTHYDSNEDQLIAMASDTGEYILGFVRQSTPINPPAPMLPANNALLLNSAKVQLLWSPTGRYDSFELEVAEDSLFVTVPQKIADLTETTIPLMLDNNKTYYWRTKTRYRDLTSEWSPVWSFRLADPLLAFTYPKASDTLYRDSVFVLRWTTNLTDSLSLTLFNNGVSAYVIKDTLMSKSNAFAWKVPKNQAEGNKYTITVKSLRDNQQTATSGEFVIMKNPTDVIDNDKENLINITPNPSNGNAKINYFVKNAGNVQIRIIDMIGATVANLADKYLPEGMNTFDLNLRDIQSGVYFCIISSNGNSVVEKIVIMK
jgi:hypothetical protein